MGDVGKGQVPSCLWHSVVVDISRVGCIPHIDGGITDVVVLEQNRS